jgi:hypothetical protein
MSTDDEQQIQLPGWFMHLLFGCAAHLECVVQALENITMEEQRFILNAPFPSTPWGNSAN